MASRFVFLIIAICISLISLTGGGNRYAMPSVKILVVGKTGSGKSTLINGLFGRKKVKVQAKAGHTLESETKDVECFEEDYELKSKKFKVIICDSPGFRDMTYSDEEYVEKLLSKCNDPDLVLYVVSMRETRWTMDQAETIAQVNKALGKEIWNNTLLVLTFANEVRNNIVGRKYEYLNKFVQTLKGIGVEIDKNMSVALAGRLSESEHLHEHGIEFWYTELLVESTERVKKNGMNALTFLILYNNNQIWFMDYTKEIFCKAFNNKATKLLFAGGAFTLSMYLLPLPGWMAYFASFISTMTTYIGYSFFEDVTLDELCK